jgi:hypothetical protein
MPPRAHELLVEPLKVLHHGQAVHDHEMGDDIRMIERGTQRDQSSAVMTHQRESPVPERAHHRNDVPSHGAL